MNGILCAITLVASNVVPQGKSQIGPLISKSETAASIGLALLQDFTPRIPGLLVPEDRNWVKVSKNKRYWLVRSFVPKSAIEQGILCGKPCELILDATTAKMVSLHLVEDKESPKRRAKYGF